ncbi:4Fe-4S cluster-binding protein [Thermococcus kodakarensis KOD1]|uniref:4Fe-4S cluster-binding protein n=1 Tax=Thermococcus kodakarensis (strain ATCC BAA-918 / JCM 12380 / KOD1) TaxID=69014 RepID=Q5JHU6_THEKO|nr:4Fe-4S dicluster domain-containing protein [Thermococcus kodakarensis]WCN27931.1 4Fe-4S dicluster domain-containing protein [Thermococcus kodakarensis]WCN30230.1 4Fe-4S dicluster domain-containing protein [Thermococcus kodakarensis]BAD86262.1 4Fe-4S cluster-binding protein [Thermococcus kodakarensis KOD1]
MLKAELCIGCGACAGACPYSAILVFENEVRRILFEPAKCGDCAFECNEVCPTGALEGRPESMELALEFARCAVCGKRLNSTKKEADYLANRLLKTGGNPELAFLCNECKRKRLFRASNKYEAYTG